MGEHLASRIPLHQEASSLLGRVQLISTVRRIAQRKLEEELEYVETDSVYSYRL